MNKVRFDYEFLVTPRSLSRHVLNYSENIEADEDVFIKLQHLSMEASSLMTRLGKCKSYWESRLGSRFGLIALILYKDNSRGFIKTQLTRIHETRDKVLVLIGECEETLRKLCNFPNTENTETRNVAHVQEYLKDATNMKEDLEKHSKDILEAIPLFDRPISRVSLALVGIGIGGLAFSLFGNVTITWNNLCYMANSSYDWFSEHLIDPIAEMIGEIFLKKVHQIVDEEVLEDSKNSLENMLNNYKRTSNLTPEQMTDLRLISDAYEKQISRPFWYSVTGSLIELMLIQIQLLKVEGLDAMTQLDRLLRENQFNTRLITMVPAVLSLMFLKFISGRLYFFITDNSGQLELSRDHVDRLMSELVSLFVLYSSDEAKAPLTRNEILMLEGNIAHIIYQLNDYIERNSALVFGSKAQERFLKKKLNDLLGRAGYTLQQREKLSNICLVWIMGKFS